DLGISADCTRITGKPEVIPGQTGSRTCQWLDVPETRFLGQPLYYRPGKYRYGSSRFVGTDGPRSPALRRLR
ncbi:MAG: hypothetical protein WBW14_31915, partial [Candidatus Acidiferrum sp.]